MVDSKHQHVLETHPLQTQVAIPIYCPTAKNLADWFTKILPRATFTLNRDALMTEVKL